MVAGCPTPGTSRETKVLWRMLITPTLLSKVQPACMTQPKLSPGQQYMGRSRQPTHSPDSSKVPWALRSPLATTCGDTTEQATWPQLTSVRLQLITVSCLLATRQLMPEPQAVAKLLLLRGSMFPPLHAEMVASLHQQHPPRERFVARYQLLLKTPGSSRTHGAPVGVTRDSSSSPGRIPDLVFAAWTQSSSGQKSCDYCSYRSQASPTARYSQSIRFRNSYVLTLRLLLFAQLLFSLKLVRLALLKAYYFRGFDFNPSSL